MFIGRKQELDFFESVFKKSSGQLVVLYGRRRIGKTELLRAFTKDKTHVFYTSSECTDRKQLEGFSKRLFKLYKESEFLKVFDDWEDSFKYFLKMKSDNKKLLIIDEFPYMVKSNTSIPSILQNLWDESFKDEDIMIVLCGSSMSFIENEVLAEKNALYGRATGIYKMNHMKFEDVNEVEFLMRQELRETNVYNTLISTIAMGNTKLNDIFQKTQIEKAKIGVYLNNLIDLGIIEREFPITEKLKSTVNVQRENRFLPNLVGCLSFF